MKNLKKIISLMLSFVFLITLFPNVRANAYFGRDKNQTLAMYQNERVRVTVQVGDMTVANGKAARDPKALIDKVKANIEANIKGAKFRREFKSLVNGFSLETQRRNISLIKKMDGVKSAREAVMYYPQMFTANQMTQAIKMQEERQLKGEGVVVSIVDSGIDVEHKDLRLTNPGKAKIQTIKQSSETKFTIKVPYGRNYADENDIVKDDEKVGKSMHGMHVAGIVAANATDADFKNGTGIRGVAPEAQLLAMKVFTNNPDISGAYDDDIIAAIEDSVAHGADIINMSLGSPMGFNVPDDPVGLAISKAREAGALVIVAAGNEQIATTLDSYQDTITNDMGLTDFAVHGSPSTMDDSFSVASIENTAILVSKAQYRANGVVKDIKYEQRNGDVLAGFIEVMDAGQAKPTDLEGKDFTGKWALVERGVLTFAEKANAVAALNAKGMILYNNTSDGRQEVNPNLSGINSDTFPVVTVLRDDALAIKASVSATKTEFNSTTEKMSVTMTDGQTMSGFTSWGPDPDLNFKPEITAPGGNIYSTGNNNTNIYMSGTSMATPHTSGLAALLYLKGKNLGLTGADLSDYVKLSLTSTAKPVVNDGIEVSPRRQGAGLAQVDDAYRTNVIAKFGKEGGVALKAFTGNKTFEVTLKNYGAKDYSFDVKNDRVLTQGMDANNLLFGKVADGFTLTCPSTVTVPANGETTVSFTLNQPSVLENFVEGFISFTSKDTTQPNIQIPFMGFNGDWGKEEILDKNFYAETEKDSFYQEAGLFSKADIVSDEEIALGDVLRDNVKKLEKENAISPNQDKNFDYAVPKVVLLRNANDLEVEIVKEKSDSAEALRVINKKEYVRRKLLEKYVTNLKRGINILQTDGSDAWDGTFYDKATGTYKNAEDGQYYFRVKARITNDTKWHYAYYPVKVDTVKPVIKDVVGSVTADGKYTVTYTVTDENSGVMDSINTILLPKLDGVKAESVTKSGDKMTAVFAQAPANGDKAMFTTTVYDYALNDTEYNQPVGSASTKITINNWKNISTYTGDYMIDGKLPLTGNASSDIASVKIGYDEATATAFTMNDNKQISGTITLKDGTNKLYAYGYDASNKLIATVELGDITNDTVKPVIEITNPVVTNDHFTATDAIITVEGKVSDNITKAEDIVFKFMGEDIYIDKDRNPVSKLDVTLNADGTFKATMFVPLNRVLVLSAMDNFGNKTERKINVTFDDKDYEGLVKFENLTDFEVFNRETKGIVNNVFTIKGSVTRAGGKLTIGGKEVTINPDLTFTFPMTLVEGINSFNVKYVDAAGATTSNYGYKILYDVTDAVYELSKPTTYGDKIYTNVDYLEFFGHVYDNQFGYNLFINGDAVQAFLSDAVGGKQFTERDFTYKATNLVDQDKILFELVDATGNKYSYMYTVIMDKVAPIITINNVSDGGVFEPGVLPEVVVNEDCREVITNMNGAPWDGKPLQSGSYLMEVKATDLAGNVTTKTIQFVVDAKPVITPDEVSISVGESPITKIKATDAEDGDITDKVIMEISDNLTVPAVYTVKFTVTDKAGNTVTKEVKVTVKGAPVIKGALAVTVTEGELFDPLKGITAEDSEDGDLTKDIKVVGNVDTTRPGTYNIAYSVTDKDGNTTTITRTVTVKALKDGKPGDDTQKPGVEPVTLIDETGKTDIIVKGDTSTLNKNWKLVVIPRPELAKEKRYANYKIAFPYDIKLTDGVNFVEPFGPVTVTIPVDKSLKGKKLFVFFDDLQKLNPLDFKYDPTGHKVTFTTKHFSVYAIASDMTNSNNQDKIDNSTNNGGNKDLPNTGAKVATGAVVVGVVLLIAAVVIARKKKENL